MTTKDFSGLVVSALKALDGPPDDQAGGTIADFLARQEADSRSWPADNALREQLPDVRLYGNVKQSRLRMILSALELTYRTARHEDVTLPGKLEIEHVMPRGWIRLTLCDRSCSMAERALPPFCLAAPLVTWPDGCVQIRPVWRLSGREPVVGMRRFKPRAVRFPCRAQGAKAGNQEGAHDRTAAGDRYVTAACGPDV